MTIQPFSQESVQSLGCCHVTLSQLGFHSDMNDCMDLRAFGMLLRSPMMSPDWN